jgi:hypothetical protein
MSAIIWKAWLLPLPLAFLILLAGGLGALLNRPSLLLTGVDSCLLPCWNDITPGHTSFAEAQQHLTAHGYRAYDGSLTYDRLEYSTLDEDAQCSVALLAFHDKIVSYIQLMNCKATRMGDFSSMLGNAEGVVINQLLGWGPTYRGNSVTLLSADPHLSPGDDHFFVFLSTPDEVTLAPWQGYISWQHYCQRYPSACRVSGSGTDD